MAAWRVLQRVGQSESSPYGEHEGAGLPGHRHKKATLVSVGKVFQPGWSI